MENDKVNNRRSWLIDIKERLSKLITKRNKCILYLITIMMVVLTFFDIVDNCLLFPIRIIVYVCTAISFFLSCALFILSIQSIMKISLIPLIQKNKIIHKFIKDYRLRTVIMTIPSLVINLIFAISNAIIGVVSQSEWYGSLAAYYIILCIMRFISVMYAKKLYIDKMELTTQQRELKVYQNCGKMLSVMSIALMGAVIMLFNGDGGQSYQGVIIYAVATYTFYKLGMSILGMIKARKEKSILSITLRNIGHSEALVAMLSLQTALFASFGTNSKDIIPIMNAITGTTVCMAVLVLGIHMTYDARSRTKTLQRYKEDFK